MLAGNPTDVFRAVTYAPSSTKLIRPHNEYLTKLWEEIKEHASLLQPICCGAKSKLKMQEMGLDNKGIVPNHCYTLVIYEVNEAWSREL